MEWLLTLVVGAAALVYIFIPFWAGASNPAPTLRPRAPWHSVEQLEIDRDLGKIDDAEYEELKPELVAASVPSLEALIYGVRRVKRVETTLETEVLIARARRKKPQT